jgi:hypothetical protein
MANLVRHVRDTRIGWWAGILLAVGVCAPSARATCGDYVIIGNSNTGHMAGPASKHDSHSMPAPGQPCHGPSCSKQPAAPMQTPTTKVQSQVEPWAYLFADSQALAAGADRLLAEVETDHPIDRANSIFRPPR